MTRIHAAPYQPTTRRETCDECDADGELRERPGPDPREWLCKSCAPEWDQLTTVQAAKEPKQ